MGSFFSCKRGSAAALLLSLSACATVPAPQPDVPGMSPDDPRWHARVAALGKLDQWDLRGRLALTMGKEGWTINLRWQHAPDRRQIDLNGPFGQGHVRLVEDKNGARLTDSELTDHYAPDAEQLLWETTGWRLPVKGLAWWVRGLPMPEPDSRMQLDAQGRLQQLRQQGWQVKYLAYARSGEQDLPRSLLLYHPANGIRPAVQVRLAVSQWQFSAP